MYVVQQEHKTLFLYFFSEFPLVQFGKNCSSSQEEASHSPGLSSSGTCLLKNSSRAGMVGLSAVGGHHSLWDNHLWSCCLRILGANFFPRIRWWYCVIQQGHCGEAGGSKCSAYLFLPRVPPSISQDPSHTSFTKSETNTSESWWDWAPRLCDTTTPLNGAFRVPPRLILTPHPTPSYKPGIQGI